MRRLDADGSVRAWPSLLAISLTGWALALATAGVAVACAHVVPHLGGDGVGVAVDINDAPTRRRYDAGETP